MNAVSTNLIKILLFLMQLMARLAADKPHIIIIMADDLVICNPQIPTPMNQ